MAKILMGQIRLNSTGKEFRAAYPVFRDKCFDVIRETTIMSVSKIVAKAIFELTGEEILWCQLRGFIFFPALERDIVEFPLYAQRRADKTVQRQEAARRYAEAKEEADPINQYMKDLDRKWKRLGYKDYPPFHLHKGGQ